MYTPDHLKTLTECELLSLIDEFGFPSMSIALSLNLGSRQNHIDDLNKAYRDTTEDEFSFTEYCQVEMILFTFLILRLIVLQLLELMALATYQPTNQPTNQQQNKESIMDYSKYINLPAIESFKRNMSTRGAVPFHSLKECLYTKGGKRRSVFTKSSKFMKTQGGIQSYGIYLAPATVVTGLNTCRGSGLCAKGCLAYSGNLSSSQSQAKQYYLTIALYHHTVEFLNTVIHDIFRLAHDLVFDGLELAVRLNSTSDLPFYQVLDLQAIARDCSNLSHFYDYTKIPSRHRVQSEYYHLTYSVSEKSTQKWIDRFDRVAMVVYKKDHKKLLKQYPDIFVDGDKHDIRALDTSKYVLLSVKRVGGFQQLNKHKSVSDDFVCTIDKVLQYAGLQGVTQ